VGASLDIERVIPRATYRMQLHKGFGFEAAAALAPYLARLGASHAYLSPYLKARAGSTHGYDIVDHGRLNPDLGDDAAFEHLCQALKAHALGHILDFVPNHMSVGGADNPIWLDVLEWGPDSPHAAWFDVDWDPDRRYLLNKILVPLLGDQYGVELERGALRLRFDETEGSFAIWAYETHKLPVWPPHYARILAEGPLPLEQIADAFGWLPNWRQRMPQQAADLKIRLAALARSHTDVRDAVHGALARFNGREGDADSWYELDALIQEQRWRVAYFRVAADDINYRRFFNVNELAGLRIELPEVFNHVHQRVLRLVKEGAIDGLRIDHIDGLFDPKGYLHRLQRLIARRSGDGFYLVVEKILAQHEQLREDWPIAGTTGYDFLNQVLGVTINSDAETAFTECYAQFIGERRDRPDTIRQAKLNIMDYEMASELNVLARDFARLARQNRRTADFTRNLLRRAIKEFLACFHVYRTYVDDGAELSAADQRDLSWALAQARQNEFEIDPSVFDFLEQVVTAAPARRPRSVFSRETLLRCAMRLQQYSGAVMAKGLEDTAFYRYNRFIALNEVGGDPGRFGISVAAFHKANLSRARHWPQAMLSTATHDTKRAEDSRARLAALSDFADDWTQQLPVWTRILRGPPNPQEPVPRPDRNDEYFLFQLLVGSWPCELLAIESSVPGLGDFCERASRTMVKSMREARVHTGWAFPDTGYENAMTALIAGILGGSRTGAFLAAFLPFARRVAAGGVHNSLLQTVIKLTAPGVPDLYNGTELWDLSMVDPDNRRPVDYSARAQMLEEIDAQVRVNRAECMRRWWHDWQDGRIKLATIATLLRHRLKNAEFYTEADYQPLSATGVQADDVCAYARTRGEQRLIVTTLRGSRRREQRKFACDTRIAVPEALRCGGWQELLTGRTHADGDYLETATLFADLPAAVLEPQAITEHGSR
jgi:(1->4)-alpha-D-glucan 1-alpha-D-glucosylmutase